MIIPWIMLTLALFPLMFVAVMSVMFVGLAIKGRNLPD